MGDSSQCVCVCVCFWRTVRIWFDKEGERNIQINREGRGRQIEEETTVITTFPLIIYTQRFSSLISDPIKNRLSNEYVLVLLGRQYKNQYLTVATL